MTAAAPGRDGALLARLRKGAAGRVLAQVLSLLAFLLLWDAAIRLTGTQAIIVPAPLDVASALLDGLVLRGTFWRHIWVTLAEILAGFAIGTTAGIVLGVLVAEIRPVGTILYPYIVAFQTIPKVAIAPLFVIWFGFGLSSKVAIAGTIAFFPVVVNVISGLAAADPSRVEMLAAFGASRWQRFKMARLPLALPFLFAGLDIAAVLSVIGAIVAEFVGSTEGIGYLIMQYNASLNTAGIFALLLVLSGIGISFHAVIRFVRRRVVFWSQSSSTVVIT